MDIPRTMQGSNASYALQVAKATELTDSDRESIYSLWEANMKDFYMQSTSQPFNPTEKREELFHPDSRFIVYRSGEDLSSTLAAYSMFRFDFEEDELVVYCYELQISKEHQRQGLGRSLMKTLLALKQKWSMKKVMLTVFKANQSAISFYQSIGFTLDLYAGSPDYEDEEDYILMAHEGEELK
ncbi:acyl-CoA N-acyltransferase [Peniophora sp. CONT]|nr:acyl-CoA N-acyltransferase [Peniophora sp. CONT]